VRRARPEDGIAIENIDVGSTSARYAKVLTAKPTTQMAPEEPSST